ncbi:MAG: protein kinase [Pirellulales bacterium]|nr:protein kinase [Pirellulales bacterium]
MSSSAETRIEWDLQIAIIRKRYEAALRAGETLQGLDTWLARVPDHVRPLLRESLQSCEEAIERSALDTRIVSTPRSGGLRLPDKLLSGRKLDRRDAVYDCPIFYGLAAQVTDALQCEFQPVSFRQGDLLLQQGTQTPGLLLLLGGAVDIMNMATGECIDCDGPGSVLGEMSLLTGHPCSAQVVATKDVDALLLSVEGYQRLKELHPEVEIALSQLVSDRLGGRSHDALCGKHFGDYRLLRCISRGSMGVVYEAEPSNQSVSVALKMLRHRFIYDDQVQSRFDQEADLLGNLRHPNIISLREHFLAYRTRFLVLDYCDGADLFHLLRTGGRLDEKTTRAILGQVAQGLWYAHQSGVIHRDLKPSNVLVDRQGGAKLTDFGLSKLIKSDVADDKAVGTPAYMPPEQFRGEEVGPPCDWYALGCLAYEMLTGKILFRGRGWLELCDEKRAMYPSDHWPLLEASDEMIGMIRGALHPNPRKRKLDLERICGWARPVPELFG